jgi:hypothetical protein
VRVSNHPALHPTPSFETPREGAPAPQSLAENAANFFRVVSNHLEMIHFSSWPGFVPAIHVFLAN